ncbi:MAG: hypothetical protein ABIJ60_02150, partial [Patescibacteria group bacterium]
MIKSQNKIEYISLKEAAENCKYSQDYLSLRARHGKLKAVKQGRNWVTTSEWLENYIKQVEEHTEQIKDSKKEKKTKKEKKRILNRPVSDFINPVRSNLYSDFIEARNSIKEFLVNVCNITKDVLIEFKNIGSENEIKDILEEFIGRHIDRGLAFIDNIVFQFNHIKQKLFHPKFAFSALLIISLIISSFLAFNPNTLASLAQWGDNSVKALVNAGEKTSAYVFNQTQNIIYFSKRAKERIIELPVEISKQAPLIKDLLLQEISRLPEAPKKLSVLSKNIGRKTFLSIRDTELFIRYGFNNGGIAAQNGFDKTFIFVQDLPKTTVKFVQEADQKNEKLKSNFKITIKDNYIKIKRLPNQIQEIKLELSQGTVNKIELFDYKTKAFPDLVFQWSKAQISKTEQFLTSLPQLASLAYDLSNTAYNSLSDIPKKLSDIGRNLLNKGLSVKETIEDNIYKISNFSTENIEKAVKLSDFAPANFLETINQLSNEFSQEITQVISSTQKTYDKTHDIVKDKINNTYLKLAEFLIPDYLIDPSRTLVIQRPEQQQTVTIKSIQQTTTQTTTQIQTSGQTITKTIDSDELNKLNQDIADLSQSITTLGSQIDSRIGYSTPSYAPINIPSSGLQVTGHSLLSTLNVSGSGAIGGSLSVGENAAFGDPNASINNTFDVYADATFNDLSTFNKSVTINSDLSSNSLTVSGNGSIGGTLSSATTTITGNFTVQDSNGSVNLFVDNNSGNVGIGTTTPKVGLHVGTTTPIYASNVGDLYVANIAEIKNQLYVGGLEVTDGGTLDINFTEGSVVFTDSSGSLAQDNTNFFWDDTNNRLGIGTSTPFAKFAIHQKTNDPYNEYLFIIASSTEGSATTTHMVVTNNGNIGIGTTSPSVILAIDSTNAIVIPVGTDDQRPDSAYTGMIRYNTDSSQFEGYGSSNWTGLGGVIDVDQDTYILAESTSGADEDVLFFYTSGSEQMRLDSNGNLGIGDASPSARLTASSTGEQLRLIYDEENNKYSSFTVNSDGDLIIGLAGTATTTTFDSNFRIDGNATTTGSHYIGADFSVLGNASTTGSMNIDQNLTVDGTGSFALAKLTIDSSGNIDTTGYASSTTYLNTQGDMHVGGNASIDGTLDVLGSTTLSGNLNITGYASTTAGLFTQGNGHIGGTFSADGASTFNSAIAVIGTSDFQGNIADSLGDLTIDDNLNITGNATTTGSHYIGGDLGVLGNASTTGSMNIDQNLTVDGTGSFALAKLTIDSSGNIDTTGY